MPLQPLMAPIPLQSVAPEDQSIHRPWGNPIVAGHSLGLGVLLAIAALMMSACTACRADPSAPASEMTRGTTALAGFWTGAVQLPQGGSSPLSIEFIGDAQGHVRSKVWLPDMHLFGVEMGPVREEPPDQFRIDGMATVLSTRGDRLTGKFAFTGLPLDLVRSSHLPQPPLERDYSHTIGPSAVWSTRLEGEIWAKPVSRAGVLYVASASGVLTALDAASGKTLWSRALDAALYADPFVAEDAIYLMDDSGLLIRLDRATGVTEWQFRLTGTRAGPPAAASDDTGDHRVASPVVEEGVVYIGSADHSVRAIDAQTGKLRWRAALPGRVLSRVAVTREFVIATSFERGAIVALKRKTGAVVWTAHAQQPIVTAPLVVGNRVIVGSRDFTLYALDLGKGTPVWQNAFVWSWIESAPALRGGVLYLGSATLRAVRAISPIDGHTLWSTDVQGLALATPLVAGETVYVGTVGARDAAIAQSGSVTALDRQTGALRWRIPIAPAAARLSGTAAAIESDGSYLFAADLAGRVVALPLSP